MSTERLAEDLFPESEQSDLSKAVIRFDRVQESSYQAAEGAARHLTEEKLYLAEQLTEESGEAFYEVAIAVLKDGENDDTQKAKTLSFLMITLHNDRVERYQPIAPSGSFEKLEEEHQEGLFEDVLEDIGKASAEEVASTATATYMEILQFHNIELINNAGNQDNQPATESNKGKRTGGLLKKAGELVSKSGPTLSEIGKTTAAATAALVLAHFTIKKMEERSSDR